MCYKYTFGCGERNRGDHSQMCVCSGSCAVDRSTNGHWVPGVSFRKWRDWAEWSTASEHPESATTPDMLNRAVIICRDNRILSEQVAMHHHFWGTTFWPTLWPTLVCVGLLSNSARAVSFYKFRTVERFVCRLLHLCNPHLQNLGSKDGWWWGERGRRIQSSAPHIVELFYTTPTTCSQSSGVNLIISRLHYDTGSAL